MKKKNNNTPPSSYRLKRHLKEKLNRIQQSMNFENETDAVEYVIEKFEIVTHKDK